MSRLVSIIDNNALHQLLITRFDVGLGLRAGHPGSLQRRAQQCTLRLPWYVHGRIQWRLPQQGAQRI